MAKGDVVSQLSAAVAPGTSLDYQPAAGVEVMITQVAGSSGSNSLSVRLFNGIDTSQIFLYHSGTSAYAAHTPWKILINNSIRLRLRNNDAAAQDIAFCGIQTK